MPNYLVLFSIIFLIILFFLKIKSNIKKGNPRIYSVDAIRIVQIALGLSFCLDFLRIVIVSQTGLGLEFFKPYSFHLIYTLGVIFYLTYNHFIDLEIINIK